MAALPILPFAVVGTTVAGVHGFAPSVVRPGETFDFSVRAEDRFYNRATGEIPGFDVLLNGELRASTEPGTEAITVVELALDEPGVYWTAIWSRGPGPAITGDANPILVAENPEYGIYWGDTHGHSGYAEGIGTLDFFLRFARDDARLDFVTHSEHDIWLDAGEWELMRTKSAEYDEPGRFIPYLGWEWTRHTRQGGGHHNVLYRTVEDQDVISVLEFPTLSELYRELDTRYDRRDVVVIPHAHNPGDFRQSHPGLEPLVEMMSMHGTFEWFMQEYLSRGHQVGVVAASDDHLSHPGYSAPNRNSLAQRGGLGAVLAPERSRDAIFDGMKARRTYATTGDRIILEFEVNGIGMGSRAPFSETREITGRVIGTAPIGSIALIKNEQELWSEDYSLDTGAGTPTDLLLTFYSEETPVHLGDAPRGWRHWRGRLTMAGATLVSIEGTDFANPDDPERRAERQRRRLPDEHARRDEFTEALGRRRAAGSGDRPGTGGSGRDRFGAPVLPAASRDSGRQGAAAALGNARRPAGQAAADRELPPRLGHPAARPPGWTARPQLQLHGHR